MTYSRLTATTTILLALAAPLTRAEPPGCPGAQGSYFCAKEVQHEIARAKKAFLPRSLVAHKSEAGAILCSPGACTTLPAPILEDGEPEWSAHNLRLSRGGARYGVICSSGPSVDPGCSFAVLPDKHQNWTAERFSSDVLVRAQHFFGEVFIASGDGCLYVAQTSNAMHPTHYKVCPDATGALRYTGSQFLHAGFKSESETAITLRATPAANSVVVHTVAAGRFVEVLIGNRQADDAGAPDWYLVRDEFGITGWWTPDAGPAGLDPSDEKIKDFYYHGD